jgi:hypothetical protein
MKWLRLGADCTIDGLVGTIMIGKLVSTGLGLDFVEAMVV